MFMVHDGCEFAHCIRHPELIPLTAFLCTAGYEAAARTLILQHVHAKGAAGLVEAGLIEADDWEQVVEAIHAGQGATAAAPTPKPADLSAYAIAAESVADDFDRLAVDLGYTIDTEDWHVACSTIRRVIDQLGMHAASLRAVAARARALTDPDPPVEPTTDHGAGPVLVPPELDSDDDLSPPPISGGAPDPATDVLVSSEANDQWIAQDSRPPIRSAGDLLLAIGQFLTSLGLEPEVQGDAVDFRFLGRLHRIELEDIESRLERQQVSEDELALTAAGLAVG
jgi:hypothetical protein